MTYQLDPERTQLMDSPKPQYGQIGYWYAHTWYLLSIIKLSNMPYSNGTKQRIL